jgi:hypothetical protein
MRHALNLALAIAVGTTASAQDRTFRVHSGPGRVNLVELFSSEGCSSCPPADTWLAGLRGHPQLWKTFVPIEFHVDYWNRLGWVDKFSKDAFTARQRQYAAEWGNWNVYTPGLVLNGKEWRPGPMATEYAVSDGTRVGTLTVSRTGPGKFYVAFKPGARGEFVAYGALLGNGLRSKVTSGENAGRLLYHEFVVLGLARRNLERAGETHSAVLELAAPRSAAEPGSYSMAFWVTRNGEQRPLQAVGGDL